MGTDISIYVGCHMGADSLSVFSDKLNSVFKSLDERDKQAFPLLRIASDTRNVWRVGTAADPDAEVWVRTVWWENGMLFPVNSLLDYASPCRGGVLLSTSLPWENISPGVFNKFLMELFDSFCDVFAAEFCLVFPDDFPECVEFAEDIAPKHSIGLNEFLELASAKDIKVKPWDEEINGFQEITRCHPKSVVLLMQ